ncbi:MAG: hypothetical protein VX794_06810 [Nitrospinota bacterium]|nr:hypothetical protein [Nitrospinota bacterium]
MKTFCIVHPKYLFVENVDYFKDPNNKFIVGFQNFINIATEIKSKVLFSNELLGTFWRHPPWSDLEAAFSDPQIRESVMQQIFPFFSKHVDEEDIVDTSKLDPSDSDPNLSFFDEISIEETKRLITSTKKIEHSFFLSADKVNYKFSYNGKKLNIKSISSANEIDDQVESFKELWPKSKSEFENDMTNCINIYMKKNGIKERRTFTDNYSNGFKNDFLKAGNSFKDRIIEKISLRLSKDEKEAAEELGDEYIGQVKQRRFRVSDQYRIMYNYIDKNKNNFLFESFDTDHDKSLKKRN